MSMISDELLKTAADLLAGQLAAYQTEIDTAYCATDKALTVRLAVKFSPAKQRIDGGEGIKIQTSISCITGRIKDAISSTVDENQIAMFRE